MKKILLGFALGLAVLSSAQQYPNNGWGDDGYYQNGDGYYHDEDDRNYFPDDYYYNYPQDYYPSDYYQAYYNDYRNSVVNINWNVFFRDNRLNRWQIDQILSLNNLYVNFSTWNNFYRYNPDRWYYDRFYALERILGPRVFVVFQNNYYRGASPIVYFQNYRRTYYAPRYAVMPRYRNVNINVYRVDRSRFRRMDNPTFNVIRTSRSDGFRGSRDDNNSGGFRKQADHNNNGFRSNENNGVRNNGGFRGNSENNGTRGGFGNNGGNGGFRGNNEANRERAPKRENNSGGFRGNNGSSRSESSPSRSQNNGSENRGGGFRNRLVSNR
ncbi:hypothetical protein [Chryseobacterium lathyri]|uniref:Uncharacterized protein n=1 Tax=Chryseobacterium lathyri TaxID=395933 RepID=A0ABT9SHA6_9FLAO|nr:hypothetical protein [Chryseobacterium lathyri]MDP9958241.1 hypothetical protein [Chryseobacterium lathyri]MDQ0066265.1 hypothetical protein [Chryseobacterium lathyri]